MEIKNFSPAGSSNYDPFLLDALKIGNTSTNKTSDTNKVNDKKELNKQDWQNSILLNALDSLENNIQIDNSSPLFTDDSAPIETYLEALSELKKLVTADFSKFASQAQANLTHGDILYLFEDQLDKAI